ncbi:MAG: molecular chaperone TorD family protein [Nitrososphaerales archaeon]
MLNNYKDVMQTRYVLYSFLSRSFAKEVDEAFLKLIEELEELFTQLSESADNEELKKGCIIISDFFKNFKETPEKNNLLTDLASEYASLFLNVGPKPVYLVESVYLGKHHTLYEEPYFEVLDAYRILGFEKSSDFKEPEDHLAVELEFMAKLVDLTKRSLDANNIEYSKGYLKLQMEFLSDHLSKWVPELCRKIVEASSNKFYIGIAKMLNGFIKIEQEFIPFVIDELSK